MCVCEFLMVWCASGNVICTVWCDGLVYCLDDDCNVLAL